MSDRPFFDALSAALTRANELLDMALDAWTGCDWTRTTSAYINGAGDVSFDSDGLTGAEDCEALAVSVVDANFYDGFMADLDQKTRAQVFLVAQNAIHYAQVVAGDAREANRNGRAVAKHLERMIETLDRLMKIETRAWEAFSLRGDLVRAAGKAHDFADVAWLREEKHGNGETWSTVAKAFRAIDHEIRCMVRTLDAGETPTCDNFGCGDCTHGAA